MLDRSFSTSSLRVLFGLPLGLEPSTLCPIHVFTQSSSLAATAHNEKSKFNRQTNLKTADTRWRWELMVREITRAKPLHFTRGDGAWRVSVNSCASASSPASSHRPVWTLATKTRVPVVAANSITSICYGFVADLSSRLMRCWCGYLSAAWCRLFAYGPADAIAIRKPHRILPHLNPDWFYLSGCPGKEAAFVLLYCMQQSTTKRCRQPKSAYLRRDGRYWQRQWPNLNREFSAKFYLVGTKRL